MVAGVAVAQDHVQGQGNANGNEAQQVGVYEGRRDCIEGPPLLLDGGNDSNGYGDQDVEHIRRITDPEEKRRGGRCNDPRPQTEVKSRSQGADAVEPEGQGQGRTEGPAAKIHGNR